MGCQREISVLICAKKADYVLSLKGNQGTLHQDIQLMFEDEELLKELAVENYKTIDGSERCYRVIEIPKELEKQHDWPNIKCLVEVISYREVKDTCNHEKRHYITSLDKNAKKIGQAIRSHWAIENSLHWILDISFRDDASRIRKENAPENISIVKHTALNLLQQAKEKHDSIKQLRKAAGWDDRVLFNFINYLSEAALK